MLERPLVLTLLALTYVLVLICLPVQAQQPEPETTTLPSGVQRIAGTEPSSHIQYARLILRGTLHSAAKGATDPAAPDPPPVLIAQCSLRPNGKYLFEMFSSFGGPANLAFYPPWKSSGPSDTFPPRTEKTTLTMDFLGYTHVKPFRRQWEIPVEAPSLYHFNPPGSGSPNLEEVSYFLRYLMSLPTLRLTRNNLSAEYVTTPLLADIHNEPLCRASGI
ncbi:MAG: hypothetical protein M3O31_10105 [Acidobacteriota bacterium]|nr:hypothetical protein [Acidobacteriota bacterium]